MQVLQKTRSRTLVLGNRIFYSFWDANVLQQVILARAFYSVPEKLAATFVLQAVFHRSEQIHFTMPNLV